MRATPILAAALLALVAVSPPAVAADREAFALAIAGKLVLNRSGVVRCHISGEYVGDGCYDFTICGVAESVCVE